MELKEDMFQKTTHQDIDMKIDTVNRDFHTDAIQKKKELLEQMKKEAEQMSNGNDQFYQRMEQDDMIRDINTEGEYSINEFGEIIRPSKSK